MWSVPFSPGDVQYLHVFMAIMTLTLHSFAFLKCFWQVRPNLGHCTLFLPFLCIILLILSHIQDPSTLLLAFAPCHSGAWIIHVRAACWWRWIMCDEQNTRAHLLSKDPRTTWGALCSFTAYCTDHYYYSVLTAWHYHCSFHGRYMWALPFKDQAWSHPLRPCSSFSQYIRASWISP